MMSRCEGTTLAALQMKRNELHRRKRPDDIRRTVGRAIIDDDDIGNQWVQSRDAKHVANARCLVVAANDTRELRGDRQGRIDGPAITRFRQDG
jgi:hypothetical protein